MRLAPARAARNFYTPTSTTGGADDLRRAAAVEFGVHLTGGTWAPPKRFSDPSYFYVFQEAAHQNACFLDALHIFVRADTDRSGTLDKQQLSNAIEEMRGCPVSKQELQDLFFKLDTDGDGKIDYMEFEKGISLINEGSLE
ncbi:hypothetical protein T484DRAFT_1825704 [Baffinella frigidus]|nr:hypothetical protein T484DRAFT_1825704 [Cryptophyta sp. CCMP2293]